MNNLNLIEHGGRKMPCQGKGKRISKLLCQGTRRRLTCRRPYVFGAGHFQSAFSCMHDRAVIINTRVSSLNDTQDVTFLRRGPTRFFMPYNHVHPVRFCSLGIQSGFPLGLCVMVASSDVVARYKHEACAQQLLSSYSRSACSLVKLAH